MAQKGDDYSAYIEKWESYTHRLYERHDNYTHEINKSVNSYSHLAIKTIYFMAGGIITFLPSYLQYFKVDVHAHKDNIAHLICLLSWCITLAASCNLFAFFSEKSMGKLLNKHLEFEVATLNKNIISPYFQSQGGEGPLKRVELYKKEHENAEKAHKHQLKVSEWLQAIAIILGVEAFTFLIFTIFFLSNFIVSVMH